MSDIFDVVDREFAQDKARDRFRKFAPWGIGVAAAIILGVAIYMMITFRSEQGLERDADEFFSALLVYDQGVEAGQRAFLAGQQNNEFAASQLTMQSAQQIAEAKLRLEDLALNGRPIFKSFAKQMLAQMALETNGDFYTATTEFRAAAEALTDPTYAHSAILKDVYARADTMTSVELVTALGEVIGEDGPYQVLGLELQAVAALNEGRHEDALAGFQALEGRAAQLGLSGLQQRAREGAVVAQSMMTPATAPRPRYEAPPSAGNRSDPPAPTQELAPEGASDEETQ